MLRTNRHNDAALRRYLRKTRATHGVLVLDKPAFERLLRNQRGHAIGLTAHFTRCWQRNLTATELALIRNACVCSAFETLDAVQAQLAKDGDGSAAYARLEAEVAVRRTDIEQRIRRVFSGRMALPDLAAAADLLDWEAAILDRLE